MNEHPTTGVASAVDDADLIQGYLAGDEQAFNSLYQRYRKPVYSYLCRMFPGRHALVDDLYQQTWLKVIDRLAGYRHQDRFISWILRISHNLAIDHCRQESHAGAQALEDDAVPAPAAGAPGAELGRDELAAAIGEAVAQLPVEQREVFLLRQEEIPFKDIARLQGVGINTVLGRMHYAVRHLQERLREWR
ncbi:MAG: RNA polymerase sigma factor CarQ [Lentisphaerae bacterium ADurb.BinA184]|nr:MAG: RNA polymerase sigma factor CarQ [Lentisphaerae bacterium ADurb.BinA184]